jgi:AraC-like DNA-binding protein
METEFENYSQIQKLLDHASEVIGLRICYHDRLNNSKLPIQYRRHEHPACAEAKIGNFPLQCIQFDAYEVHQALKDKPEGRIHTCPYGLTEIAVPVFIDIQFAGVLFAGPCWTGKSPVPYSELKSPEHEMWLKERQTMLQAISAKLSSLLQLNENSTPSRKTRILTYLKKNQHKKITISQLSSVLYLSPSRTSHIVNELFKMSLPNLINSIRLEQASHMLSATEFSIGEIAKRLGYEDQNYFTRVFTRKYKLTPSAYRKRYSTWA